MKNFKMAFLLLVGIEKEKLSQIFKGKSFKGSLKMISCCYKVYGVKHVAATRSCHLNNV